MTDDVAVQHRISCALSSLGVDPQILIPGCGSRTALQRRLIAERPSASLVCVDFPGVIALANEDYSHPNLSYVAHDLSEPKWTESFDAVVAVNAIVSEHDEENRRIVRHCSDSLRPDGIFVGYFPTLFSPLEIAMLSGDRSRLDALDLQSSTFYESGQQAHQIFYTPLRLRTILREAGLAMSSLEIVFLDSAESMGFGAPWRNPGADDDDLVIYELFVIARRA